MALIVTAMMTTMSKTNKQHKKKQTNREIKGHHKLSACLIKSDNYGGAGCDTVSPLDGSQLE